MSGLTAAQANIVQGTSVESFDGVNFHDYGSGDQIGYVIAVHENDSSIYALNQRDAERLDGGTFIDWGWDSGSSAVEFGGWTSPPNYGDNIYFVSEVPANQISGSTSGVFWVTWRQINTNQTLGDDVDTEAHYMVAQFEKIPTPVATNIGNNHVEFEVDHPSYTDMNFTSGNRVNQGTSDLVDSYSVFINGRGFSGWEYIGDTTLNQTGPDQPIKPNATNPTNFDPANNDTGTHVFNTQDAGVSLISGTEYQFKVRANIGNISDVSFDPVHDDDFEQYGDPNNYTTQGNSSVLTLSTAGSPPEDTTTLSPAEGEVVGSEIGELTSVPPVPEFTVEIIDIPDSVEAGDEVTVDVLVENNVRELGFVEYEIVADVSNTGASSGEATFDLRLNGEVVDSKTVDLPPGALSGTEQIAFSGILDEPGSYTVEVGTALVGEIDVPGGRQDTQDIIIMVEGAEIDRQEITLDHRESTELQFSYTTSEEDVGSLLFEVFSDDDNDSAEVVVNESVTPPPPEDGLGLTTILGILLLLLILLILIFLYIRWRRLQGESEQDRFEI